MKHLLPHKYLLEKEETYEPPEDPDSSKWILSFELQLQQVHCDILEAYNFSGRGGLSGETAMHHPSLHSLIALRALPCSRCPTPQSSSGMNGVDQAMPSVAPELDR